MPFVSISRIRRSKSERLPTRVGSSAKFTFRTGENAEPDRDHADLPLVALVLLRQDVAPAELDGQLHRERGVLIRQRGDVDFRVHDLHVRRALDVRAGHVALAALVDAQDLRLSASSPRMAVCRPRTLIARSFRFRMQLRGVFAQPGNGGELVQHAVDARRP